MIISYYKIILPLPLLGSENVFGALTFINMTEILQILLKMYKNNALNLRGIVCNCRTFLLLSSIASGKMSKVPSTYIYGKKAMFDPKLAKMNISEKRCIEIS